MNNKKFHRAFAKLNRGQVSDQMTVSVERCGKIDFWLSREKRNHTEEVIDVKNHTHEKVQENITNINIIVLSAQLDDKRQSSAFSFHLLIHYWIILMMAHSEFDSVLSKTLL